MSKYSRIYFAMVGLNSVMFIMGCLVGTIIGILIGMGIYGFENGLPWMTYMYFLIWVIPLIILAVISFIITSRSLRLLHEDRTYEKWAIVLFDRMRIKESMERMKERIGSTIQELQWRILEDHIELGDPPFFRTFGVTKFGPFLGYFIFVIDIGTIGEDELDVIFSIRPLWTTIVIGKKKCEKYLAELKQNLVKG